MPVMINDFEVVAEPQQSGPVSAAPTPAPQLTPREIETIVQRSHERAARVRAH